MVLDETTATAAHANLSEPENSAEAEVKLSEVKNACVAVMGSEKFDELAWALMPMIRVSKWDVKKATDRMRKIAAFFEKRPELLIKMDAQEFMALSDVGMMSHLPTRNDRGELVLTLHAVKLGEIAKRFTYTDLLRFSVFYMRDLMQDEQTQINGVIILENLANYPMFAATSMKGMGPKGMKASFDWLHASPMRLRGIYGLYQPWYIGIMLGMVKPFMKKKLRDRVELFDQDGAALLQSAGLRPEQVPVEYGGTMEGFDPSWHLKTLVRA